MTATRGRTRAVCYLLGVGAGPRTRENGRVLELLMSDVIVWALLGGVALALVIACANWEERRAARRYGSLCCPGCGVEFGPASYTTWHTHTRLSWRCRWESGPYMRCQRCGVGFRYTQFGRLHPQQFEEEAIRRIEGDITLARK
jgi:hypothetical protein